jgi:hypothetical protein
VIFGGWAAVNEVFVREADGPVLIELKKMPCGEKLAEHIENLKSGRTPMDSIRPELLPYGGAMNSSPGFSEQLSESELKELKAALEGFASDRGHLDQILDLSVVKKFGEEWALGIANALASDPDLTAKWKLVQQTDRAYDIWDSANSILSNPITERARALVQSDLLEYETYLPMFGDAGADLLSKLHAAVA